MPGRHSDAEIHFGHERLGESDNPRVFAGYDRFARQCRRVELDDEITSLVGIDGIDIGEVIAPVRIRLHDQSADRRQAYTRYPLFARVLPSVAVPVIEYLADHGGFLEDRIGDYLDAGAGLVADEFPGKVRPDCIHMLSGRRSSCDTRHIADGNRSFCRNT